MHVEAKKQSVVMVLIMLFIGYCLLQIYFLRQDYSHQKQQLLIIEQAYQDLYQSMEHRMEPEQQILLSGQEVMTWITEQSLQLGLVAVHLNESHLGLAERSLRIEARCDFTSLMRWLQRLEQHHIEPSYFSVEKSDTHLLQLRGQLTW